MKNPLVAAIVTTAFFFLSILPVTFAAPVKGDKAPDFTAQLLGGGSVTLSSLQGKYVILDFWGSWCRNCILGFPALVEAADKYSKNLEVVGVVCSDTPEKAGMIVEKKGLKWKNAISDDKTDIAGLYGVTVYPTKILIDPAGKIAGIFTGETDELYKELEKLFEKQPK